ncbi:sugar phosphate nucleotidyltransferase [Candidatus Poriferisocius sp.]|uniref:sugar phosphate nucleotidyltransferase n=1 Tax=Candidatus Poriferisocius sp. TaxID=3101276 RepID=UPI003B01AF14
MDAVVLVGGFGTRLRPLTLTRPKQMLPVVDRPMIEHVVGRLGQQGVTRAVLSLGYRPDAFEAAYPQRRCAGVELVYAVEPEPLDTAGAIGFAARTADVQDTFIAVNGDVINRFPLIDLLATHRRASAQATIALAPVADPSRYGVVVCDPDGRVRAFLEKPPAEQAPSNQISVGIYALEPSALGSVPEGARASIEREVFPRLVDQGEMYAVSWEGFWVDAGTPEAYLEVQLALSDGGWIHPRAVIDSDAFVSGSIVMEGAKVSSGASVTNSALLPGATVGRRAAVERSVVGFGAEIGDGARLSDLSVVGDGAAIAPAAVLSSERVPGPG